MSKTSEQAVANHHNTFNCAQAVACALCEELGADKATVFRLMEGFGKGMGDAQHVCGAVSGAIACAGLKNSDANLEHPATKAATMALGVKIKEKFLSENKSVICKELKGLESGKPLHTCDEYIACATKIAEDVLLGRREPL